MTATALAPDYESARTTFRATARRMGGALTSRRHPRRGPLGEELAVDIATFGDVDATHGLLVVSGTHGVEGFAGSALQHHVMRRLLRTRPEPVAIVLLHALNPYGFAWCRRTDEDNIDLNRNFIDWSELAPENAGYEQIAELLIPTALDGPQREEVNERLMKIVAEVGERKLQGAISSGQYRHPEGLFFGGHGPSWAHDFLSEWTRPLLGRFERLAILDLHTGLGEWGELELITHAASSDALYQRIAEWFGEVRSEQDGTSHSVPLNGDWLTRVGDWLPDTEVTGVTLEFGNRPVIDVLEALRSDAWLHSRGDPLGPEGVAVKLQMRTAFADDNPAWISTITPKFEQVFRSALHALAVTPAH